MDRSPVRDFIVGLFVLVGLGAIAYLTITIGGLGWTGPGGFFVYASFDQTGGLKPRAPVVVSGVKVGQVDSIALDKDYRARVEMNINPSVELPVDTSASIMTAGLLGDRFVLLQPGGETELLKSGGEIAYTESAVLLERLIGQFIYGSTKSGGAANGGAGAAQSGGGATEPGGGGGAEGDG